MAINYPHKPKPPEPSKLTGEAKEYYELIEELLESGKFDWAEETLMSIGEWIEDHNHVTNKQIVAIENISEQR